MVPLLDEAAFRVTLEAEPAVVSFALGHPGELVERAHEAGAKVIHQVHTVGQARRAAELGVDAIIAQGSEAGGQGMALGVGAMALIPQVADAVDPIPVLAAGGVADGRGLAAALVLGAQGANVGTRFLASEEASADEGWKRAILEAESEDGGEVRSLGGDLPARGRGRLRDGATRAAHAVRRGVVRTYPRGEKEAERLREEVLSAIRGRTTHELLPFTGQTAGMVHDILPAGEIVERMVAEAERALARAEEFRS